MKQRWQRNPRCELQVLVRLGVNMRGMYVQLKHQVMIERDFKRGNRLAGHYKAPIGMIESPNEYGCTVWLIGQGKITNISWKELVLVEGS